MFLKQERREIELLETLIDYIDYSTAVIVRIRREMRHCDAVDRAYKKVLEKGYRGSNLTLRRLRKN